METQERARQRLENVRSVEPILSALHTISMGSWQAALKQTQQVQRYEERLKALLPLVVAHLPTKSPFHPLRERGKNQEAGEGRTGVLVIGSERGLCGQFNAVVIERAEEYLVQRSTDGVPVELMVLGKQVRRLLERRGYKPSWSGSLSIATLPSLDMARNLVQQWLRRYESYELDAVDVVYNAYRGPGKYEPAVRWLIPPQLPADYGGVTGDAWNAPTVETDPLSLYTHTVQQWAVVSLYMRLLDSATAEHAARYSLMELATQNAEQIIQELTLVVQTARQRAITREMQELAIGAGMVGPRGD